MRHAPLFERLPVAQRLELTHPDATEQDDAAIRPAEVLEWTLVRRGLAHLRDAVLDVDEVGARKNVRVFQAVCTNGNAIPSTTTAT